MLAQATVDLSAIVTALTIIGIASNAVSIYVALYVRARIAPIIERQEAHHETLRDLGSNQERIWTTVNDHGRSLAKTQGQCQACRLVENVTASVERAVTAASAGRKNG